MRAILILMGSASLVGAVLMASCGGGEDTEQTVVDDAGVPSGGSAASGGGCVSDNECTPQGMLCINGVCALPGDSGTGGSPGQDGTGATGGAGTGGGATGGSSTGGSATGGVSTGGSATGGVSTGGSATGGVSTGGSATGGAGTGGDGTGGTGTGGDGTGGDGTGGEGTGGDGAAGSGSGGDAGSGTGGTMECGENETLCGTECAHLDSDPDHCGSCDHACGAGQYCVARTCRNSPCDGLCFNPQSISQADDGFRAENFGTDAQCYEVQGYIPTETSSRIVCWNFGDRTLTVNGQTVECLADNGYDLEQTTDGVYCVSVSAGDPDNAGFILPIR
jgi:hypothetical protein